MSALKVISVFRRNLFANKVAIVTGGATGIGRAITKELLYLGCRVVIASRKEERLRQAVQEIGSYLDKCNPPKLMSIPCNIRKEDQVQNLISQTIRVYGKLDYLVNNGGGQFVASAQDTTSKGWDAVVETNLKGNFLMCKEAFNQWMSDHGGSIVNITMTSWRGYPMMAHSSAARAGLENLTKSLAIEWAENGVRINCVAPGSSIYSKTAEENYALNVFELIKPNIPAKRLGTPEEISAAVCFLLSPGASFITGEILNVDCGGRLYSPLLKVIPEHNKLPPFIDTLKETDDTGDDTVKSKL